MDITSQSLVDIVYRSLMVSTPSLHRSYSQPSQAPTQSLATWSSVSLRKWYHLGLKYTCLLPTPASLSALRSAVPWFFHPSAHSAVLPHLIALSFPHTNRLKSTVKKNNQTTMRSLRKHPLSVCAPDSRASGKSPRSHSELTVQPKARQSTRETTRGHVTTRTPSSQTQVTFSVPPGLALSTAPDF